MIYDLMVVARLKENARQLKKLFKGLDRDSKEVHYDDCWRRGEGVCHGSHHWTSARITNDWWQVTCLVCVSTHFSRWKKGLGSAV